MKSLRSVRGSLGLDNDDVDEVTRVAAGEINGLLICFHILPA